MNEYALLIDGQFQEIRRYDVKPVDIPHKKVTWHPVVREYGVPGSSLEKGTWYIRATDPATLPPPVPEEVSAAQIRLFLDQVGMLADVEATIATMSKAVQIEWEYRTEFHRSSPLLNEVAKVFQLTDEQIDDFFRVAEQL